MRDEERAALLGLLLGGASTLVDEVQERVRGRGFDDIRPAHGFAFVRISRGGATTTDLAEHLGVTKQAASVLVTELVAKGYVAREPHPYDARAHVLGLTDRGWACTRAATEALAAAVGNWEREVGSARAKAVLDALEPLAHGGRLRPVW